MKRIAAFTFVCLLICVGAALAMGGKPKMPEKLYAIFETSQGKIVCLLYPQQAPETVANFVGLAQGTKEWTDPRTGEKGKGPLYDGTIFHRVIPDFMVQGGDPLGQGIGGPGYKFKDEFAPDLGFDQPGRLAMANSGPGTNGSQFFITVAPTTWLNGKHTIFGQVIEGQDVVEAISQVKRDDRDKPLEPVVLKKLTITEQI
ncbi:MAG TPA: peptidylprolyl isomerase [Candidatus Sulfotelmatobacter sp.]|nr:peptidylprolyl isomerase [Candidatus Sulfotelmatobacter sp.]